MTCSWGNKWHFTIYISQVSTQFLVPKVWNQIRLRWLRGPSSPTIQGSGRLATRTRSLTPLQSKINGSRLPYPILYFYFTHHLNMFLQFLKKICFFTSRRSLQGNTWDRLAMTWLVYITSWYPRHSSTFFIPFTTCSTPLLY